MLSGIVHIKNVLLHPLHVRSFKNSMAIRPTCIAATLIWFACVPLKDSYLNSVYSAETGSYSLINSAI